MNSSPPTLTGFNNNVRYRGMRFHIQTEDSGVTRPHITTHLFADGGHVIKSLRTDYAEYVDHPERVSVVQRLMREQHRAMALELRDGKLDATIDRIAPPAPEEEAEPAPATQLSARPPAPVANGERGLVASPAAQPAAVLVAPAAVAPPVVAPPAVDAASARTRPVDDAVGGDAPTSRPTSRRESSDVVSSGQTSKADSQPLWDTQLRPKNTQARGRRRSSEPRSSRRAPASSSSKSSSAPPSRSEAPAEKATASSRRSESQRGQSQRPSSRSGAASSRSKARKSDQAASAPVAASEAPASSRRSSSSRSGRGATGAAEPRASEPATSSRSNNARNGSRAPRPDVTEPQPASAPSSSRRGRPAAALPAKPGGPSLFGPLPQDSLDDAILTYAARAKTPPSSRGSK